MASISFFAKLAGIVALLLLTLFFAIRVVDPVNYANSDFFSFWLAGRLALEGQNPYAVDVWVDGHHQYGATWISDLTFLYPLPLSFLFLPFGAMPLYPAYVLWVWLLQWMILAAFFILFRLASPKVQKAYFLPLAAGLLLFRPAILTITYGQLSGFLLLVMAAVVYLWEKEKFWQGAALLPLMALKPNLGGPVIIFLTVFLLLKRQWKAVLAEGVAGLVLAGAGWLQDPSWLGGFLSAGNTKLSQTFGFSPTVWGISAFVCDFRLGCTVGVGAVIAISILGCCFFWLHKNRNWLSGAQAIGMSICLALLITPYTWTYDQLLLSIPIISLVLRLGEAGHRFLPVALLFLTIDILAFALLALTAAIQKEGWNAIVALFVLVLLFLFSPKINRRKLEGDLP